MPREINQHGDLVYDVFHGDARRAWGIKDEATARRWLKRLSAGAPGTTPPHPITNGSSSATPDNAEEPAEPVDPEEPAEPADESYVPPRVWWNES